MQRSTLSRRSRAVHLGTPALTAPETNVLNIYSMAAPEASFSDLTTSAEQAVFPTSMLCLWAAMR